MFTEQQSSPPASHLTEFYPSRVLFFGINYPKCASDWVTKHSSNAPKMEKSNQSRHHLKLKFGDKIEMARVLLCSFIMHLRNLQTTGLKGDRNKVSNCCFISNFSSVSTLHIYSEVNRTRAGGANRITIMQFESTDFAPSARRHQIDET